MWVLGFQHPLHPLQATLANPGIVIVYAFPTINKDSACVIWCFFSSSYSPLLGIMPIGDGFQSVHITTKPPSVHIDIGVYGSLIISYIIPIDISFCFARLLGEINRFYPPVGRCLSDSLLLLSIEFNVCVCLRLCWWFGCGIECLCVCVCVDGLALIFISTII